MTAAATKLMNIHADAVCAEPRQIQASLSQFKGKHEPNLFFSFLTKQKIAGFKYLLFFYFAIMPSCWVSPSPPTSREVNFQSASK